MRLALFQPEIPQNTGTMMRLAAALGVSLDIIEPCGFLLDDRKLRRAGMDYLDHLQMIRHCSFEAFEEWRAVQAPVPRLVLLSTKADQPYSRAAFRENDILMVGQESAGVPPMVAAKADLALRIPLQGTARSLNVATAAAMVLGEALRQTGGFGDGA